MLRNVSKNVCDPATATLRNVKQTGLWEPNPPKNVFMQIQNYVNNTEILAHELVGGESEMLV